MKRRLALLPALAGMISATGASAHVGDIAHSESAHALAHVVEIVLLAGCIAGVLWLARGKRFF